MARIKRRKNLKRRKSTWQFSMNKRTLYLILVIGAIVMIAGGSTLFATFNYSSFWGADVELDAIKFGSTLYDDPTLLPEYAFNIGARTVTADFDDKPANVFDWNTADSYYGTKGITYADDGMKPTVNYDVSRFVYYDNVSNVISESLGYLDIDVVENTTDIHYYFGFSVMFSTAAYSVNTGEDGFITFIPAPDIDYVWYTEGITESAEVQMTSTVAIRFEPIVEGYTYEGTLNSLQVVRERAYYVTNPPDSSYDTIDDMNANYGWHTVAHHIEGYAESLGEPTILYDVINSDTEKMATIELGAKLRPAFDPVVYLETLSTVNPSYDGYITVGAIDTYNVGFIYDIVVDVSINDIPLSDQTAIFALGRYGINTPVVPQPEPWYITPIVLILVLVAGVWYGKSRP